MYVVAIGIFGDMIIKELEVESGDEEIEYELDILSWMAPEVNIVAFYYSHHGEFIFDAVKFENRDFLRNKVSMIININN